MAVLDMLDTLAPIREKVEAGERLDFEDGVTLMESDDLLALGELADLARRVRGGERRGLLRPEPQPVPDERLPREVQVLRVREDAASRRTRTRSRADELVEDALAQHEVAEFTEIHCVNGENPHVDLEFYAEILRKLHGGAAGRPSQVLHRLRDPPHVEARGLLARGGAARAEGCGPRLDARRRRGDLRRPRARS